MSIEAMNKGAQVISEDAPCQSYPHDELVESPEPRKVLSIELKEFTVVVAGKEVTVTREDVLKSSHSSDPYVLSRFRNDNDFLRAIAVTLAK